MRPDAESFALTLRALVSTGCIKDAQQLLRSMHEAGVPETSDSVATLIITAAVADRPDIASAVWMRSGATAIAAEQQCNGGDPSGASAVGTEFHVCTSRT